MGTGDPIEESKCKCYSKKENKTEETNKKICKDIIQETYQKLNKTGNYRLKSITYPRKSVERLINIETHPGEITGLQGSYGYPERTIKYI